MSMLYAMLILMLVELGVFLRSHLRCSIRISAIFTVRWLFMLIMAVSYLLRMRAGISPRHWEVKIRYYLPIVLVSLPQLTT